MPAERRRPLLIAALVALTVPILVVTLVVAAVIPGLPWWIGLLGIVIGPALVWFRLRSAATTVLARCGGTPVDLDDEARLANLVEELSLRTGSSTPELRVVSASSINAAAVSGAGIDTIVATRGLLDTADRMELEAVTAELLVRFRDGDAAAATEAVALLDWLWIPAIAPLTTWARRQALPSDSDLRADAAAVGLTRYPPALEALLRRAERSGTTVESPGAGAVWLLPTVADAERTPLDVRIDVLAEFS